MWAWTRRGDIYDARQCRRSHNAERSDVQGLETIGPTFVLRGNVGAEANDARRCGLGPVGATFMTPGDVGGRIMPSEATCRVWKPPALLSYFVETWGRC